jgi:hypothetical protein
MEAIKYYVKGAFVGIAETPAVVEQQEELISDLTAKVADLVADGRSEEEALGMAIASMGDLSGLVKEFATEEPAMPAATAEPVAPPAVFVEAYTARLRLHVVTISVGLSIGALFVMSVLALVGGSISGPAAASDVLLGIAGLVWIGYTLRVMHAKPSVTEAVELLPKPNLRTPILQWVGVCAFALFANAVTRGDFWAWTVWVAAAAWPLSFYVEQRLLAAGKFLYPKTEAENVSASVESSASVTPSACA